MGTPNKLLLGKNSDTSTMVGSVENLQTSKRVYIGSFVTFHISDSNKKEIARFELSGENFDDCIDSLVEGIKSDLRARLRLREMEISQIKEII